MTYNKCAYSVPLGVFWKPGNQTVCPFFPGSVLSGIFWVYWSPFWGTNDYTAYKILKYTEEE